MILTAANFLQRNAGTIYVVGFAVPILVVLGVAFPPAPFLIAGIAGWRFVKRRRAAERRRRAAVARRIQTWGY